MPVTVELPEDKLEFEFDDSYSNDQILEFLKRKPWAEALGGAPAKGVVVPEQPAPAPSRALAVPPINPITPVGEMSIRGYSPRETERTANIAQAGMEAIGDTLNTPLYKPFGIESLPTVTGQDIEKTLDARGMAAVAPGLAGMALQAPRTTAQIIAGLQQAVVGAVEFFTTPAGALTLGASELPQLAQKGVAAYFVYQMAKQSPEMVKELAEAWYSNDPERLTHAAASLGLNTAFIAGGTKATLAKVRPEAPPIIEQPTTEVANALQIEKPNAEVLREQTPPPEQQLGLREVVPSHVESEGAARPETAQVESVPITKPPVAGEGGAERTAQAGATRREPRLFRDMSDEDLYSHLQDFRGRYKSGQKVPTVITQMREELAYRAGQPEGTLWGNFGFLEETAGAQAATKLKKFTNAEADQTIRDLYEGGFAPTAESKVRSEIEQRLTDKQRAKYSDALAAIDRRIEQAATEAERVRRLTTPSTARVDLGHPAEESLTLKEPVTKPAPESQRVMPGEGPGTGVGPGGTTEVDVGTRAELAQLTDSIKSLAAVPRSSPEAAFSLGERVAKLKDGISDTLIGLKAAAGYMQERLIGKPVWTDFKAALGDRHLALSESAVNARKWARHAEKAVRDPKLREAISNWIDAGGDLALLKKAEAETKPQYREGYRRAQNLTAEEKLVAQNVRNYFDARLNDAIDAGILENGIEDYIHRTYETDSPWKQGALAELRSGLFTGKPALAKKRVFEYDFEAEKAGRKPIKSFIKRVAAYDMSLNKAIADRKAVKDMMAIRMPDGRPMIDVGGIGVEVPKEGTTEATLIKPHFKPTDAGNPANNRSDFTAYDYPAFRKWKWVSNDANGNPIMVQGDVLVHPGAIGQVKTLFERSKVRQNPVGRAALGISSTIKQTMLDLSGFHFTQITVHGWEHRSFKPVREIDFENPDVRGLIRGGLQVGDTRGYELFSEGLAGSSLTKHIPGIGPKLQAWNEYLFQEYIPRLKLATGLHALERNRARFKDLSEDQLNHLTANQMNAAFGELNYEMLGRSKTTQDVLRLALLAPDFLEARGRFSAQAGTKYGREQFQALALGAATLYITARIMNKLLNDEWHFEKKNLFSIVYKGRAYSLRTVQGDLLHLADEPGRFMYNRLNPVYGRTGMEALTGRDAFGRKRDLGQQLKDFAQTPVPISFRGWLHPDEQKVWESFLNAFGITERRASSAQEIYRQAEKYRAENKIRQEPGEFIYDPEKDPYRSIRLRALYGDPEEVAEAIKKSVEKGDLTREQIRKHFQNYASHSFVGRKSEEAKFKASLSADQKKLYDTAIAERRKVLANVLAGLQK